LIKKIEKTLKRIEDDDFGFCDTCGIEIGVRRLEARPTADLCIDCKTMAEIKEKQLQG
jgi:DnaK suppressor protein